MSSAAVVIGALRVKAVLLGYTLEVSSKVHVPENGIFQLNGNSPMRDRFKCNAMPCFQRKGRKI